MYYFTTVAVAVMFLKFCNRLFVISYTESKLIIEARQPRRTISIASTVLGDSRARTSVWYDPQMKSLVLTESIELAEIQRTRLATSGSSGKFNCISRQKIN